MLVFPSSFDLNCDCSLIQRAKSMESVRESVSNHSAKSYRLWLGVFCTLNKTTIAVHISKPTRGSHRTSNNDRKTNVPIKYPIFRQFLTWGGGLSPLTLPQFPPRRCIINKGSAVFQCSDSTVLLQRTCFVFRVFVPTTSRFQLTKMKHRGDTITVADFHIQV